MALCLLAAVLGASACGKQAEVSSSTAPEGPVGLGEIAAEVGRAFFEGELSELNEMLLPDSRWTPEELEVLQEVTRETAPTKVENLEVEITRTDPNAAEVSYSGEVCAPELQKNFPATSVAGNGGDSESMSSDGEISFGEVVCTDLQELMSRMGPFEFVNVEGQWYGTLPGTP